MKYFIIILVVAAAAWLIYKKVRDSRKEDTAFTGRAFMDPEEYEKQAAAVEEAVKEPVQKPVFKKSVVSADSEVTADGIMKKKQFAVAESVRLLIVDDDQKDAVRLKNLAEAAGAGVTIAESGIKCLELVKETAFDVFFIARDMSRMDGVQTVRNMKKQEDTISKDAPVYAVISQNSDEPAVFFEKEGFAGIIRKPIGEFILHQSLAEALPREKVLSDDSFIKEICKMAEHEKKLQESGVLLSEGLKNYGGSLKLFREEANHFCDSYEAESNSIMDSLYSENAMEYMDKVRTQRNLSEKLGALYLADMFDDHVNMAKNDDMEVAEASWRTLELEWENVVSGISHWLGRNDTITNATEVLSANTNESV